MVHVTREEEEFWKKLHEGKEMREYHNKEIEAAMKKTFFRYHETFKNLRDR